MKNILIPIDFSEVSLNAARYSALMYSGNTDMKIILYHMYGKIEDKTI